MLAYILNLVTLISINAVLAITLNFIMGYAGIFSMAHAVFFGVGAYTAAYFAMHFSASFFLAVPVDMFAAAVLSSILALPALRVRRAYCVAASLGLHVLGVAIFAEWKSCPGGLGGAIGIPPAVLFGFVVADPAHFMLLAVRC